MRETLLLLLLMTAMTAFTLRPMLEDRSARPSVHPSSFSDARFAGYAAAEHGMDQGVEHAIGSSAAASGDLDNGVHAWILAEKLAAHFPGHARLRAEAAAGDRAKW